MPALRAPDPASGAYLFSRPVGQALRVKHRGTARSAGRACQCNLAETPTQLSPIGGSPIESTLNFTSRLSVAAKYRSRRRNYPRIGLVSCKRRPTRPLIAMGFPIRVAANWSLAAVFKVIVVVAGIDEQSFPGVRRTLGDTHMTLADWAIYVGRPDGSKCISRG
jgi:hypothetical protein